MLLYQEFSLGAYGGSLLFTMHSKLPSSVASVLTILPVCLSCDYYPAIQCVGHEDNNSPFF